METNYPSSGSKGNASVPGTGTTGGTAGTTGSSAGAGNVAGGSQNRSGTSAAGGASGAGAGNDLGSTRSTSQGASHSGASSSGGSNAVSNPGGQAMGSEGLRDELSSLKRDLDDLVSRATSLSDRELSDARDKMMIKFSSMRNAARGMADQARTQLNQGVDVTTDYVKEKPLQSVAIAAGVGLLVGALMRGGRD